MNYSAFSSNRLISLDALRGLALLGILMMNIIAFAYPSAIYENPFALGELSSFNFIQWFLSEVFFAEKCYALFAMLFGAGIAMMAAKQSDAVYAKQLHRRRMFWLLLIGLLHAVVFWWGDILVTYALGGMLVYQCRNWTPRRLVLTGILLQAALTMLLLLLYFSWDFLSAAEQQEIVLDTSPPSAVLNHEIAAYQGSWWERAAVRVDTTLDFYINALLVLEFRICGLMLIGMALFKTGILSASRSLRFYQVNGLLGLIVGTCICTWGALLLAGGSGNMPEFITIYRFPNYWGALFTAWGYLCTIMWLVKRADSNWQAVVVQRLAAVGRLALSNYLAQTLLCCSIFYGWGLGLFGQLERTTLVAIVIAIWSLQIALSGWWIKHFAMGPAERIWRNLVQRRWQPVLQRRT